MSRGSPADRCILIWDHRVIFRLGPTLLAAVLALTLATSLAACGAGSDEGSSGEPAEAERPGAPDPGGVPGHLLEACRTIAEDAPALSDDARAKVVRECEGAATGDERTMRRAAEAACDAAALAAPSLARGPAADACKAAIP